MRPVKRRQEDELDRESSQTTEDFIKNHCPELVDHKTRLKCYGDYEYPEKQKSLLKFWETSLTKFFKHNFDGSVVQFTRIEQQFRYGDFYPQGLQKNILKLWDDKQLFILRNETEKEQILPLISPKLVPKKVGAIESIARFFKKPVACLKAKSLIIDTSTFKKLYKNIEKQIGDAFMKSDWLLENVFQANLHQTLPELIKSEEPFVVYGLYETKLIQKTIYMGILFIWYNRPGMDSKAHHERMMNVVLLEKRLDDIDFRCRNFEDECQELKKEALKFKISDDSEGMIRILNMKKIIENRITRYANVRLLLIKNLYNLKSTKEEDEVAKIIEQTTNILNRN